MESHCFIDSTNYFLSAMWPSRQCYILNIFTAEEIVCHALQQPFTHNVAHPLVLYCFSIAHLRPFGALCVFA